MSKGGIPIEEWSGAKATKELHETVKRFGEESSKQTRQMLRLTWAIVGLTVTMLIAVFVQIIVALA